MIDHFEEIRIKFNEERNVNLNNRSAILARGGPGSRDEKVFFNFILAFFRLQSILYSRIGVDELENLEPEVTRQMNDYFLLIDKE